MPQFLAELPYGPHPRQRLDLFLPEKSGAPLFLFVHGGGWRGGDKAQYRALGELLAGFGYAVALPNHRLAPEYPHPAAVEDLALALATLSGLAAESGVRAESVCLAGHSSGAHLATLLALHPRYLSAAGLERGRIGGVIGISGVYDLAAYQDLALDYLAPAFGADVEVWREASPLQHVHASPPPFFLAWAERDYPGAAEQAQRFGQALRAAGGDVRLLPVAGRDHLTILTGARSLLDPLALGLAMFLRSLRAR